MFKKVKSLLIAGLMVVSMSGNVFAAEESTCIIKGGAGIHNEENHIHTIVYSDGINEKEAEKLLEVNEYHMVEKSETTNEAGRKVITYEIYFDGNCDKKHDHEKLDKHVETVVVEINDKVGNGKDKGWMPEITPQTGDAIALGGLAVAGIAGVGLVIVNRKKRNK